MITDLREGDIIAVNKPVGMSSFGIIARLRRLTGIKRIGHAGTLDPLASGVLVVGIGRTATRQLHAIVEAEKEYRATIVLGQTSTTDDEEGDKTSVSDRVVAREEIEAVLPQFIGQIEQVPSVYSAIKVAGQRAYHLARQGREVVLTARPVEIRELEIMVYVWPRLEIRVVTGPGVYIRALARDLGAALGVGGYITQLQRTRVGQYRLAQTQHLDITENRRSLQ